jgi:3',5'-cyclic-AMP phosphodiesterase
MSVLRLIQFTDLHLYRDADQTLRGIATLPALKAALADARSGSWPPDLVLLSGDLVQDDTGGYAQLDSCQPGMASGQLSASTLAQLDAALGSAPGRHCLVTLHHHPVPMASRWLDRVGLENAADFFSIVDRHRNVRAIVWGHVHQAYDGLRKGVRLLATPSTCAQFVPHADEFAIDRRPPAYRTLELQSDGGLLTEVVWVEKRSAGSSASVCSAA